MGSADFRWPRRRRRYHSAAGLPVAFLVVIFLLISGGVACNLFGEAPALPDVPPISFDGAPARPSPVSPSATPAPSPTPDSSELPGSGSGSSDLTLDKTRVVRVPQLALAELDPALPDYDRRDWNHWVDTDGDCQDTRAEVLIEESLISPAFASARNCRVVAGNWLGPYTGERYDDAGEVDIDHLVPLKNAHLSGGWRWNKARKEDYANSTAADYHLIAVDKRANRAKGARGPEEWQPPDESYHCLYALDWIAVKAAWGLTATDAEWAALEAMLANCPVTVAVADDGSPVDLDFQLAGLRGRLGRLDTDRDSAAKSAGLVSDGSPAAGPGGVSASGLLLITEFMPDPAAVRDSAGEWFEIYNPSVEQTVNLEGWTIRDGGRDEHRIAIEVLVPPGAYLALGRNSDKGLNGGIEVAYEYGGFNLANEEDTIELVDPAGHIVDSLAYHAEMVFPGASTSLDPSALESEAVESETVDAGANDNPADWCRATNVMDNGDYGTPGQRNDAC